MSDNIQTNITGRLMPCLQKKIDKTTYLVEVLFSDTSTQSVEDKLSLFMIQNEKEMESFFENQLERLGVEYMDLCVFHGIT